MSDTPTPTVSPTTSAPVTTSTVSPVAKPAPTPSVVPASTTTIVSKPTAPAAILQATAPKAGAVNTASQAPVNNPRGVRAVQLNQAQQTQFVTGTSELLADYVRIMTPAIQNTASLTSGATKLELIMDRLQKQPFTAHLDAFLQFMTDNSGLAGSKTGLMSERNALRGLEAIAIVPRSKMEIVYQLFRKVVLKDKSVFSASNAINILKRPDIVNYILSKLQ